MVFVGSIALVGTALFAGAALHITANEHPARLSLPDEARLAQWRGSFTRAQRMAPPLALIGFAFGMGAWWQSNDVFWLLGALLVGANIPFTLIAIQPTNRDLLAASAAGPASNALIAKWGDLHHIRTALALAATTVMAWALAI